MLRFCQRLSFGSSQISGEEQSACVPGHCHSVTSSAAAGRQGSRPAGSAPILYAKKVPSLRQKPWKTTAVPQFHAPYPALKSGSERAGRQLACAAADHALPGYLHSEKCPEKRSFFAVQRRSLIAAAQANCQPPLAVCKRQGSLASRLRPVSTHLDFMSKIVRILSRHQHLS